MNERYFDAKLFNNFIRPQQTNFCGPTSVVTVYNYLYNTVVSVPDFVWRNRETEKFKPIVDQDKQSFERRINNYTFSTANKNILEYFDWLKDEHGGQGSGIVLAPGSTMSNTQYCKNSFWKTLKKYVKDPEAAIVYHCYNHYNNVSGFVENPHYLTGKEERFMILVDSSNGHDMFGPMMIPVAGRTIKGLPMWSVHFKDMWNGFQKTPYHGIIIFKKGDKILYRVRKFFNHDEENSDTPMFSATSLEEFEGLKKRPQDIPSKSYMSEKYIQLNKTARIHLNLKNHEIIEIK